MNVCFLDLRSMHEEIADEIQEVWSRICAQCSFVGAEYVGQFEQQWAEYCGTAYCVGVADGTVGLELSLRALGIRPGDEVIVPGNTFIATAEAVVKAGGVPVFIDVDPATHLITADGVAAAITPRTAAVVVVHLYGQPADMDAIRAAAIKAGIAVVEDAAQAHGATWQGKRVGGLSDIASFSFYPGKNLGAFGDAGAVVTNDPALAERVRLMSNHGRPPNSPHLHELVGGTHRLDALQAAILTVKLKRLDAWNAARERAARLYAQALAGLPVELVQVADEATSSHHLTVIRTSHRDELRRLLAAENVATGIHYPIPCHLQKAFRGLNTPPLPMVERLAGRILSLPMFPHISEAQIRHVADAIARAFDRLGRLGVGVAVEPHDPSPAAAR
jgi:dTDP-4-amino-4,6-dideoxygalactose transaminase